MGIEQARTNMLKQQIRATGVLDDSVLNLLQSTPREQFVPSEYRGLAFADMAIPLNHDQKMFTPTEEGQIIQALAIKPTDQVLEIGTGSGYLTALLARQAAHVDSVDIFADFTTTAAAKLEKLGLRNVKLFTADAAQGWGEPEAYSVVVITGSMPFLNATWRTSVKIGGRLFAIVGKAPAMHALLLTRVNANDWQQQDLFETVVPQLINAPQSNEFLF